jgi:predicted N-acetyltransferase YhbS
MKIGLWLKQAIIESAAEKGLKTVVELGEAAFYGPKAGLYGKRCHWS